MRKLSVLILFFALVFLAGCEKKQGTVAASFEGGKSEPSAFKMALTTEPTPPVEDQATLFKLNLTDTSGKPVTGAEVKADLKMTSMDMGKNEVTLADKGSGNYEGRGTFTMAGPWKVTVTAKQGDKSGQQSFDIVAHRK